MFLDICTYCFHISEEFPVNMTTKANKKYSISLTYDFIDGILLTF